MRLIGTIRGDQKHLNPYALSLYLKSQGISNECEEILSAEGKTLYRVWIEDEDDIEKATQIYEDFCQNPEQTRYLYQETPKEINEINNGEPPPKQRSALSSAPYGILSSLIIAAAIFIYLFGFFQKAPTSVKFQGIEQAPFLPPFQRTLLFDYPSYFEMRDHLLTLYTPKDIEEKSAPSLEAQALYSKILQTPFWNGLYDRLVHHLKNPQIPLSYSGPFMEKIREGQTWRLFTPALLHYDFLHIFFNLLWFILLGNQIEYRLGSFRYLLLIIAIALISNLSQYLMSGPFFMGLSGIVCGLAGFIWARQQIAPWEGYLLQRVTLIFLAIFVFGMFLLQVVAFFLFVYGNIELNLIIANTAHIAGALSGYVLGRLNYFKIRQR